MESNYLEALGNATASNTSIFSTVGNRDRMHPDFPPQSTPMDVSVHPDVNLPQPKLPRINDGKSD